MWDQVTIPFAKLLGNNLYPTLYEDKDYRKFLDIAGITPPYPPSIEGLSANQRRRLLEYAELRGNLLSLELDGLKSLEHANAKAVEIPGPVEIYRMWNSEVKGNEFRFFWFSGDLFQESLRQVGRKKQDRLEWLRGQMAVSYNWSL
jgi:hypothetical protein